VNLSIPRGLYENNEPRYFHKTEKVSERALQKFSGK
jgi:hypothetical protein